MTRRPRSAASGLVRLEGRMPRARRPRGFRRLARGLLEAARPGEGRPSPLRAPDHGRHAEGRSRGRLWRRRRPHAEHGRPRAQRACCSNRPSPRRRITLPSHATIMTGLVPPSHGVRGNGSFRLGSGPRTLAEALRDRGLRTAAFVGAFPLDHRFGLARGFERYDDALERAPGLHFEFPERRADNVVASARAWLAAPRARCSPGSTSTIPTRLTTRPPPSAARIPIAARSPSRTPRSGPLLAAWDARPGPALTVLAADHGEAFGEHGEESHSLFVYDTTLRVPLILRGTGLPAGVRVKGAVGARGPGGHAWPTSRDRGRPARRLAPAAVDDGPRLLAPPLYAETLAPALDFGWSDLRAWRDGRYKYIRAPRPELYDLVADPGEEHDLAAREPARVQSMARALDAAFPRLAKGRASRVLDAEAAERLRALGYVQGPGGRGSGADPKDKVAVAREIARAVGPFAGPARRGADLSGDRGARPREPARELPAGRRAAARRPRARGDPAVRRRWSRAVPVRRIRSSASPPPTPRPARLADAKPVARACPRGRSRERPGPLQPGRDRAELAATRKAPEPSTRRRRTTRSRARGPGRGSRSCGEPASTRWLGPRRRRRSRPCRGSLFRRERRPAGGRRQPAARHPRHAARGDRLGAYGGRRADAQPRRARRAGLRVRRGGQLRPPHPALARDHPLGARAAAPRRARQRQRTCSPPTSPTLATLLKARGYATGAFVGAYVLDRRFGLARGFDVYDDRIERRREGASVLESERPVRGRGRGGSRLDRRASHGSLLRLGAPVRRARALRSAPAVREAHRGRALRRRGRPRRRLRRLRCSWPRARAQLGAAARRGRRRPRRVARRARRADPRLLRLPVDACASRSSWRARGSRRASAAAGLARGPSISSRRCSAGSACRPPRASTASTCLEAAVAGESYAETLCTRARSAGRPSDSFRLGGLKLIDAPAPRALRPRRTTPREQNDLVAKEADRGRASSGGASRPSGPTNGRPPRPPSTPRWRNASRRSATWPPPAPGLPTRRRPARSEGPASRTTAPSRRRSGRRARGEQRARDRPSHARSSRASPATPSCAGVSRPPCAGRVGTARPAALLAAWPKEAARDAVAWHERALALAQSGRAQEAIAIRGTGHRLEPAPPRAPQPSGTCSKRRGGRFARALGGIRRRDRRSIPTTRRPGTTAATCCAPSTGTRRPRPRFGSAAELARAIPIPLNGLGVLLVQSGRARRGGLLFRRALEMAPEFAEARLNLAVADGAARPARGGPCASSTGSWSDMPPKTYGSAPRRCSASSPGHTSPIQSNGPETRSKCLDYRIEYMNRN